MTDMGLVVVGAAGRMGRTLIRVIAETPGVRLAGAIERAGAPEIGKDCRRARRARRRTASPSPTIRSPLFAKADGVLDFTVPAATVAFAELAAQARIVHVIGTTGLSADDEAKIAAAARHAVDRQVRQHEPRRQPPRRPRPPGGEGARRRFRHRDRSRCTTATRSTRRPAPRCCSATPRPRGAASTSPSIRSASATATPAPRKRGDIGFATLRGGSVVGEHTVIFAGDGETDRAHPQGHRPRASSRAARSRRRSGAATRSPASTPWPTCSAFRRRRLPGIGNHDGSPARARPPRTERMEPQEPLHRLARRRPDRAGHRRGARRRPAGSRPRASPSASPSPRR